ncbi:MAG: hypothetical protein MUC95_05240, partial [Spirochaetes bacterium]|nr:hypothetical protein [Spirochaetota bacterium]
VNSVKSVIENGDINTIKNAKARLEKALHEASSAAYGQQAQQNANPGGCAGGTCGQQGPASPHNDGGKVYDAEYEVVDEERKAS